MDHRTGGKVQLRVSGTLDCEVNEGGYGVIRSCYDPSAWRDVVADGRWWQVGIGNSIMTSGSSGAAIRFRRATENAGLQLWRLP